MSISSIIARALIPDKKEIFTKWANQNIVLDSISSSLPGNYRVEETPYMTEIINSLSPDCKIQEIKFMKSSQIGGTVAGIVCILAYADMHPSPILVVLPSKELATDYTKLKLNPLIDKIPNIKNKIYSEKGDLGGLYAKNFEGGMIRIGWSGAVGAVRSLSIRVLMLDDVDGYPHDLTKDGNSILALKTRTYAMGAKKKIFINSTPTIEGRSNIEKEFEESDKRYYNIPCPECKEKFVFKFDNFHIDYDKETYELKSIPYFNCPNCGSVINESSKPYMLKNGEWIATKKHRHRGYHISAFYSPLGWYSWEEIAVEYLNALKALKLENNNGRMRAFVNTILAQTFAEEVEKVEVDDLQNRKELYYNEVPDSVKILTAGVDIQGNRIEVEVVGWDSNYESWSIDYEVFWGKTTQDKVWQDLREYLLKTWKHRDGLMKIYATAIDSGHLPEYVYKFCKDNFYNRFFAIKGASIRDKNIVTDSIKNNKRGKYPFIIGVNKAKDMIYEWLAIESASAGYMHFPNLEKYNKKYFDMLTVEIKDKNGRWGCKKYQRNEAIDIRVYAFAVLGIANVDLPKLTKTRIFGLNNNQAQTRGRVRSKGIEF